MRSSGARRVARPEHPGTRGRVEQLLGRPSLVGAKEDGRLESKAGIGVGESGRVTQQVPRGDVTPEVDALDDDVADEGRRIDVLVDRGVEVKQAALPQSQGRHCREQLADARNVVEGLGSEPAAR